MADLHLSTRGKSSIDSVPRNVYQYDKLPKGDTFRFLTLQPGVGNEPIRCNLHTAKLAGSQFEAISYVWGTPVRDQEILCDSRTMLVTPNLLWVLQRVRRPDKPRTLWADSICIHQDDDEEKGHQVSLFGQIYRAAQRVLVCLGPDEENDGPAVSSLLDEVNSMIEETFRKIDKLFDSFPYPEKNDPLLTDSRWGSFRALLARDWFKRGWVVQEVALARHIQIIWGHFVLDWDKVMRTYLWLEMRAISIYNAHNFQPAAVYSHRHFYAPSHEDFAQAFYDSSTWSIFDSHNVLETLDIARELQLQDPRDRVYAFTELPQAPGQHIKPWPNYRGSYLDTYRQFATEYVQATKDTRILDYVSHGDKVLVDIPSWVPRWNIPVWSLSSLYWASALHSRTKTTHEPLIEDDGSLKVRGVIFDTVLYISDLHQSEQSITVEAIRKIWKSVSASTVECPYAASYGTQSIRLEAFLGSLSVGGCKGEYDQWILDRESFAKGARLKQTSVNGDSHCRNPTIVTPDDDDSNIYLNCVRSWLLGNRFILTARGYMGLAPAVVREGALCGIVFGCRTPCILQRTARDKHYKFLGGTGLMGKQSFKSGAGTNTFRILGTEESKDWVDWDVEEQDIYLC